MLEPPGCDPKHVSLQVSSRDMDGIYLQAISLWEVWPQQMETSGSWCLCQAGPGVCKVEN